jgi:ubiquinone/menaquinone biosynthesis C-methylase UbiE
MSHCEERKPPVPFKDGRIQSLNNMGAESPKIDYIREKFSISSTGKVLEVGSLYGACARYVLEQNDQITSYVAVDMDECHIYHLDKNIKEKLPAQYGKLTTLVATYPEVSLEANSFDSILISRVLHFMNTTQLSASLDKTLELLKPGACAYVLTISVYTAKFKSFIPVLEQRIKKEVPHPGFVDNLQEYADPASSNYKDLKNKPFYFFTKESLEAEFLNAGFVIAESRALPLEYYSQEWSLDNRENIGLTACKPVDTEL